MEKIKECIKKQYNNNDKKEDEKKRKKTLQYDKSAITRRITSMLDSEISFIVSCCIDKPKWETQSKYKLNKP